jgi:hypothetical protein
MKSSRRENIKVAVADKDEALLRLWTWALYGFAVIAAVLLVQLRIAAFLANF